MSFECMFCEQGTRVRRTHEINDGLVVVRNRECENGHRFRTEEHTEWTAIQIQKRGEWVEPFDEEKLRRSIEAMTPKRPIDKDLLDQALHRIRCRLITETPLVDEEDPGCVERVVDSATVYAFLLDELKELDELAYLIGVSYLPEEAAKQQFRELAVDHGLVAEDLVHLVEFRDGVQFRN